MNQLEAAVWVFLLVRLIYPSWYHTEKYCISIMMFVAQVAEPCNGYTPFTGSDWSPSAQLIRQVSLTNVQHRGLYTAHMSIYLFILRDIQETLKLCMQYRNLCNSTTNGKKPKKYTSFQKPFQKFDTLQVSKHPTRSDSVSYSIPNSTPIATSSPPSCHPISIIMTNKVSRNSKGKRDLNMLIKTRHNQPISVI